MGEWFKDIMRTMEDNNSISLQLYSNLNRLNNNPKIKTEFHKQIDSYEPLNEILRQPFESVIIEKLRRNDKSPKLAQCLQLYWNQFLKLNVTVDSIYWPQTQNIESIFRKKFWLPEISEQPKLRESRNTINENWTKIAEYRILKTWVVYKVDVNSWENIRLDMEDFKESTETKEKQEKFERKIWQITLVIETAKVYWEYLASIESNIMLKMLSNKDERYVNQIKTISSEISILSNKLDNISKLSPGSIEDIFNTDIKKSVDKIFVSERSLPSTFVKYTDNITKNPEVADKRYAEIRNILINWDSPKDNFSNESLHKKRIRVFELLRENDKNWLDDDKHRFNTNIAIQKWLENDILCDWWLRMNEKIRSNFDVITKIKDNPSLKLKLVESLKSWKEWVKSFLKENNFKLNENRIEQISKEMVKISEEIDKSLKEALKKDPKLDIKTLSVYLKSESLSKLTIFHTLDWNKDTVKSQENTNNALKLYANIEWIWDSISDSKINNCVSWIYEMIKLVIVMRISWWLALRMTEWLEWWKVLFWWHEIINKIVTTSLEWAAFYWSFNWLVWLLDQPWFKEIKESYNLKDMTRMILFLGVLKWLLRIWNIDKMQNKVWKFTLETWALLWTDVIIKIWFKEWIPKTPEDSFEFIKKELMFIIPFLLSLKWLETARVKWEKIMTEIEILPNHEIKIIQYSKERISEVTRQKRNLEQMRNIERQKRKPDKRELKAFNSKLHEKKQEIATLQQQSKESRSPEPESQTWNVNYTVNLREAILKLSSKKLNDTLIWLDKVGIEKLKLSDKFEHLLDNFTKDKDFFKAKKEAREIIDAEVTEYLKEITKDKPLNKEEQEIVDRFKENMSIDFVEAIKQTKEVQNWLREEIDWKFWNIEVTKKLLDPFVKVIESIEKWNDHSKDKIKEDKNNNIILE